MSSTIVENIEEASTPRRRPGESWKPVDLSAVLADGYEPPRPTIGEVEGVDVAMFYAGRINAIFGDSGGGKTWFALYVIAEQMNAGRDCILIDYEDHPASQVARLEQIGVPRATIIEHLIYIQPSEKWTPLGRRELEKSLAGRDIAVAVLDSTGEALAADGVSPNADEEVARWFRGTATFLAGLDAAVILLDHTVKSRENSRSTEFASGSQRKRAAINGAAYYLDVISAPSRDTDGHFKLLTRKDRFGWRKHGSIACEVAMKNIADGGVRFTVSEPLVSLSPSGKKKLTWYMEAVSKCIEGQSEPISKNAISKLVNRNSSHVHSAIASLIEEGYATASSGPRGAVLITSAKAYRENDDRVASAPSSNADDYF